MKKIFLLIFPIVITSKYISNLININSTSAKTMINFGEPPRIYYFSLDMNRNYSAIADKAYILEKNIKNFPRGSPIELSPGVFVTPRKVTDKLRFLYSENDVVENFNFYFFETVPTYEKFEPVLSLVFKYFDYSYSLVHQMKDNNLIDNNLFGITVKENSDVGKIFFGRVPESEKVYREEIKLRVEEGHQTWGTVITDIIISGISFSVNEYGFFQTNTKYFLVSNEFYNFLQKNFLQDFYKKCRVRTDNSFFCEDKFATKFPVLTIRISNNKIVLNKGNLFGELINGYREFLVKPNDDNKWVFGTCFYVNNLVTFDYDKKEISFFSDSPMIFQRAKRIQVFIMQFIGYALISILILFCLISAYYCRVNKNREDEEKNIQLSQRHSFSLGMQFSSMSK